MNVYTNINIQTYVCVYKTIMYHKKYKVNVNQVIIDMYLYCYNSLDLFYFNASHSSDIYFIFVICIIRGASGLTVENEIYKKSSNSDWDCFLFTLH